MGELGFPILFLPDPPQPAPNSLSRSPGEEGVWDPGESLTRGTESKRGKVSRREGGRVRNAAPNPRASVQALAPSERGGAIPDGQGFPPGEAGTPIPLSAPGVGGSQESPTLTSCLPRSDESPPQEAPDLGPPRLQERWLPWPPGEPAGLHPLPGLYSGPALTACSLAWKLRSRRRLDKELTRRS